MTDFTAPAPAAGVGVDLDTLCDTYPRLYHMAWEDSMPSIRAHGLLSTSSLLDLYQVRGERREVIEGSHRPRPVPLEHDGLPGVVIRDQHPLSDKALRRCLTDDTEAPDWYELLNQRVYFWLSEKRLNTMMQSPSYRALTHWVLTLDTRTIASRNWERVRLTAMNTGCTVPFAHPRGRESFYRPEDFPWQQRRGRGDSRAVEFTVLDGVREFEDAVISIDKHTPSGAEASLFA